MDARWQKVLISDLGLLVHILDMPAANSVACGVLVRAGTRDERWPEEAGLAHALEHMIFQGTRDFPDSQSSSAYIEDVGGGLDAATSGESTLFYNQVPFLEIERAIYTLSQLLLHSTFGEDRIKPEMQNVIQEIRMTRDNAQEHLLEWAKSLTYGRHPLGRPTLGTEKAVAKFERRHFQSFYSHYYNRNNFDFIIVGRIDSVNQVIELIRKYFADLPDGPPNDREIITKIGGRNNFSFENRDLEQVHIAMLAPTVKGACREARALGVFEAMIGGGASFPLFVEVREKSGLCYEIWADHALFSDISVFVAYVGTDPRRYKEAVEKIFKVIRSAKDDAVLLEKSKKRMTGGLALQYDNPLKVLVGSASIIGLYGNGRDYSEIIKEIQSISIGEVEAVVDQYLLYNPHAAFTFAYMAPNDLFPTQQLDLGESMCLGFDCL